MAEGFLRNMAGEGYEVYSAGSAPTVVNPAAVKVMKELGIDISRQRSKSVEEFSDQYFDYIVTVCDNMERICPVFPGDYKKIHWNLEDPAAAEGTEEERLGAFRKTRDRIRERIKETFLPDLKK